MKALDEVQQGLGEDLVSHRIVRDDRYLSLVRPGIDGPEYEPNSFQEARVRAFRCVWLTAARQPPEALAERCYVVRVKIKGESGR